MGLHYSTMLVNNPAGNSSLFAEKASCGVSLLEGTTRGIQSYNERMAAFGSIVSGRVKFLFTSFCDDLGFRNIPFHNL